jgi:predicted membrane protein
METGENYTKDNPGSKSNELSGNRRGKMLGGLIIVLVGAILLSREMGVYIPYWVTSWPMIPIVIGLFIGVRHGFKDWGWMIPVIIGIAFLLDDIFPAVIDRHLVWPMLLILIGLIVMFGPSRKWKGRRHKGVFKGSHDQAGSSEDMIDSAAIFGGIEKNIVSKDFKGGEAVSVFGGTSLNLSQSDIKGRAVLELVQIFGGTKLIVPADWQIKSEMVSIFGGIEDKRSVNRDTTNADKVLVIEGTTIFGGIEIRSY